jgi:hypothetical protein
MRERVWEVANVQLDEVTVDTDTTVHTLFGNQMGGRKSYIPKNKGKKSCQPILGFIAEMRGIRGSVAHWRPAQRPGDRGTSGALVQGSGRRGEACLRAGRLGLLLLAGGRSL